MTGCVDDFVAHRSYHPIYAQKGQTEISISDPIEIKNVTRVYYKDDYVFLVNQGLGIHVLDYKDKTNPQNIGFINIIGCEEVELKFSTLYTKQFSDLLAIDLSDIQNLKYNRFTEVFERSTFYPPPGSLFMCPDPSKGHIVGWVEDSVFTKYECSR